MTELKKIVHELFEHDKQMHAFEKEIKVKRGQYHHLLLKNAEKVYSDDEVVAINKAYNDLVALENQRHVFNTKFNQIRNSIKAQLSPLEGGKWLHQTDDVLHPLWEFWVEDDELKYARLNGTAY
jgi:23S rRNA-/tRNA-specific pseudouridylate synthase